MEEQKGVTEKGGTMRLGAYPCTVREGTHTFEAYQMKEINERHATAMSLTTVPSCFRRGRYDLRRG